MKSQCNFELLFLSLRLSPVKDSLVALYIRTAQRLRECFPGDSSIPNFLTNFHIKIALLTNILFLRETENHINSPLHLLPLVNCIYRTLCIILKNRKKISGFRSYIIFMLDYHKRVYFLAPLHFIAHFTLFLGKTP